MSDNQEFTKLTKELKKADNFDPVAKLNIAIATHQANLQIMGVNQGAIVKEALEQCSMEIERNLPSILKSINAKIATNARNLELKKAIAKINEISKKYLDKAQKEITKNLDDISKNEQKYAKKLTQELDPNINNLANMTTARQTAIISNALMQGKTVQEWFNKLSNDQAEKIGNVITKGFNDGHTIEQLIQQIVGTKKNNYTDGIIEGTRKEGENIARTLVNGVANNAKEEFYQANSDVISGVEILSTLDGRTCPLCAGLDRTRYKLGAPHPTLPLHNNCRCVLLPVTPFTDTKNEYRPMANADFMKEGERLHAKSKSKRDWGSLSTGTKKKYYYQAMREYELKTGKPAYTLSKGGVSFENYFKNHMSDEQRKDWLGAERYKIWKNGNLKFDKFITPVANKRLTVAELKELDKKSFKRGVVNQPKAKNTERFANGTIMVRANIGDYPNDKKYNVLKPCYQSALKSPEEFLEKASDKVLETKREYCASYDKDGNLFTVSCGKANAGDATIDYPYPNGKVYHNHITESSFSAKDIEMFINGEMKEMTLITPKKVKYNLTFKENGVRLDREKITSKYSNARKKHNDDFHKIWEEVFKGTDYEYKIL